MNNFIYRHDLGGEARIAEVFYFPTSDDETSFRIEMLGEEVYKGEKEPILTESEFHREFKFLRTQDE